jgi:hypothetical protein
MIARTMWVDMSVVEGIYASIFDAEDMHIPSGEFITPHTVLPPRDLIVVFNATTQCKNCTSSAPVTEATRTHNTARKLCPHLVLSNIEKHIIDGPLHAGPLSSQRCRLPPISIIQFD